MGNDQDNRRIISEVGTLYFEKGMGCLSIAFRTCLSTALFDPPCETILEYRSDALGEKSAKSREERVKQAF